MSQENSPTENGLTPMSGSSVQAEAPTSAQEVNPALDAQAETPACHTNSDNVLVGQALASEREDGSKKKESADGAKDNDPAKPNTGLLASYARRSKISLEIQKRTGLEFSRDAIDGFLDTAHAIDLVLKSIAQEDPPSANLAGDHREVAVPDIKFMTWDEWRETGLEDGKGTRKGHWAIDVLVEEPQPYWAPSRVSAPRMQRASDTAAPESRQSSHTREDGTKSLPARIRINSAPAKRILDTICNDELDFDEPDPLIIARPFKVLVVFKDAILNKMSELERMYEERLSKTGEGETVVTGEEAHSPAQKNEETKEGSAKNAENVKSNEGGESAVEKPRIFSTRTKWSDITLTEAKEAVEDFRCLVRFITETLQPVQAYFRGQPMSVSFSNLWHLFPVGSLVYVKQTSTPQKIWRIHSATGGRRYLSEPREHVVQWHTKYNAFTLYCYYLDFDGEIFFRVYKRFTIEKFDDAMSVGTLQIMPLAEAERIIPGVDREKIRKRGEQFLAYKEPRHRYYQGTTQTQTPNGTPLFTRSEDAIGSSRLFSERVESPVVVDFERGIEANPEWVPAIDDADRYISDPAELDEGFEHVERDTAWDTKVSDDLWETEEDKRQRWNKGEAQPAGDDLLLLPDRVLGYVLRTRTWACLRLGADDSGKERLTEIDPQSDSWRDLEIPAGHRNIVQALINTHFRKDKAKDAHFDLVREKGKGVIILLHGVPGVGKTATAECVAASHGKPLLPITCGDLGLKPKEVEHTLQSAFQLAQAWGCVMLLDEADIFLAQRTNQDIERNALVSVFLRILEYYEGVLFLTTNRVGTFDEAFKSRIHMSLYYPPLKWPSTEKIWRNLIRRACEPPMKLDCDAEELIAFAKRLFEDQSIRADSKGQSWNGRQIRNAFQSAVALARNESNESNGAKDANASVTVKTHHFKTVADVSDEFNNYMWKAKHGQTDADIAAESVARYDQFSAAAMHPHVLSQTRAQQFPDPTQISMPMRPAMQTYNTYQGFPTPQSMHQQPAYPAMTGSPYNPNQQPVYGNAQSAPPPAFNIPQSHVPQQSQFTQHLHAAPAQYQAPQATSSQQYPTVQTQPGPISSQYQPGPQSGFTAAGGNQTISPQASQAIHPNA